MIFSTGRDNRFHVLGLIAVVLVWLCFSYYELKNFMLAALIFAGLATLFFE